MAVLGVSGDGNILAWVVDVATRPIGLASLAVFLIGTALVLRFRRAPSRLRLIGIAVVAIAAGLFAITMLEIANTDDATVAGDGRAADQLATEGRAHQRSGHHDRARASFLKALALYRQQRNPQGEAAVLADLGRLEHGAGNLGAARNAFAGARSLLARERSASLANLLLNTGDLERELGDLSTARTAYSEALSIYKEIDENIGQAFSLRGLAEVERASGNDEAVRRLFGEARAHFDADDVAIDTFALIKNLTNQIDEDGETTADQEILRRAEKSRLAKHGKALVAEGLGDLERDLGNHEAALAAYLDAAILYNSSHDIAAEARVQTQIGEYLKSSGEFVVAKQRFERAATLLREADLHEQAAAAQAAADAIASGQ